MKYPMGRCSVSSDGSTMFFTIFSELPLRPGVSSDLYSMKINGSNLKQLTSGPLRKYWPWISTDGQSIVYISTSTEDQGSHVVVIDIDGHNPRQLTSGDFADATPSYSRDGSKVIFARAARNRPYSMGGMVLDEWDIWEINSDGSSMRQLTFGRYYNLDAPYFSPDGKHVLFGATTSIASGDGFTTRHDLFIFDLQQDGSATNLRRVPLPSDPSGRNYDGQPSFSPDGATVVFTSLRVSGPIYDYEIWKANLDGTNLQQITHNQSQNKDPIFSPDGKFIYFWNSDLWRIEANGSNPMRILPAK